MINKLIREHVLALGSQDDTGDPKVLVQNAINFRYRQILAAVKQDHVLRELSLTTVAATSKYGLPLYVKDILNIEDTTNKKSLHEMSRRGFDKGYPGVTDTGTPDEYYSFGRFGVQKQPASAGAIGIVSDDSSDVGKLRVTGKVSNNLETELITLNGTTEASGSKSFATVERIAKEDDDTRQLDGNITVEDSSNNTIATIPTWVKSPTYIWIELRAIPDAALTYTIRAWGFKPDLVNDEDWPEFDEDFHDLLVLGAAASTLSAFGKEREGQKSLGEFMARMRDFKRQHDPRPNQIKIFTDVTNRPSIPRRPLVTGIDVV